MRSGVQRRQRSLLPGETSEGGHDVPELPLGCVGVTQPERKEKTFREEETA